VPEAAETSEGLVGFAMTETDWRDHGVAVIPGDPLDANTPQTLGMSRAAAINFARVGAQKIWAGTVSIQPNAEPGAHHHAGPGRTGSGLSAGFPPQKRTHIGRPLKVRKGILRVPRVGESPVRRVAVVVGVQWMQDVARLAEPYSVEFSPDVRS
jgi:hypothetical protein